MSTVTSQLIELYNSERFIIEQFHKRIVNFFTDNPRLNCGPLPVIHSIKSRMKDPSHLVDKLDRKSNFDVIDETNFFDRITDLSGVRVLHLYPSQFGDIYTEIRKQIEAGEWFLFEPPVAYTWDPDSVNYFTNLGIATKVKPSYYTSVHIVVQPKKQSTVKTEIQIRTLFEPRFYVQSTHITL